MEYTVSVSLFGWWYETLFCRAAILWNWLLCGTSIQIWLHMCIGNECMECEWYGYIDDGQCFWRNSSCYRHFVLSVGITKYRFVWQIIMINNNNIHSNNNNNNDTTTNLDGGKYCYHWKWASTANNAKINKYIYYYTIRISVRYNTRMCINHSAHITKYSSIQKTK